MPPLAAIDFLCSSGTFSSSIRFTGLNEFSISLRSLGSIFFLSLLKKLAEGSVGGSAWVSLCGDGVVPEGVKELAIGLNSKALTLSPVDEAGLRGARSLA